MPRLAVVLPHYLLNFNPNLSWYTDCVPVTQAVGLVGQNTCRFATFSWGGLPVKACWMSAQNNHSWCIGQSTKYIGSLVILTSTSVFINGHGVRLMAAYLRLTCYSNRIVYFGAVSVLIDLIYEPKIQIMNIPCLYFSPELFKDIYFTRSTNLHCDLCWGLWLLAAKVSQTILWYIGELGIIK